MANFTKPMLLTLINFASVRRPTWITPSKRSATRGKMICSLPPELRSSSTKKYLFPKKMIPFVKKSNMSAYRQILYHIVFRTKGSEKTINHEHRVDLYQYFWGIVKNKKCVLFRINGMEDHIHILSDLHPSVALADYIRDIKVSSSKWIKNSGLFPDFNG